MNVDALLKYLAEAFPDNLAAWLLGRPIDTLGRVEVIKGELPAEPIYADFVAILRDAGFILHVEFLYANPAAGAVVIELRMLDYWVRLYRKYGLPVVQVLVVVKPTRVAVSRVFEVGQTRHEFRVVRLWEEDPEPLLADDALLPLATLARATDRQALVSTVAARVRTIESAELRREISTLAQLLAGLVSPWEVTRTMFGEELLKESSVYQEIIRRGRVEGEASGEARGRIEGAEILLLGLLEARFGEVPDTLRAVLDRCPIEVLRELAVMAASCESIEAFAAAASTVAPPPA